MIGVYELDKLLSEYGINSKKIIKNNANVIDYGFYHNIKMILDYLVNELQIRGSSIEKSPSVLYLNVNEVKSNYEYLKDTNLNTYNIETCLHILSTDHNQLIETYNYVIKNYGYDLLSSNTSILAIDVVRIQNIERLFRNEQIDKKTVLSACISRQTIEEIEKIIKICKENNIEITGSVFLKSAEEIEKIIKVCQENKIEITGSVFLKSAEEIEKIIKICKENNIEITGSVFNKSVTKLNENIEYIKNNYDSSYLTSLIVSKNKKNLEIIFPYLDELGVLPIVKNSASILTLTIEEIMERKELIDSIGENMINGTSFHSIFGMSKRNYMKKKEQLSRKI